MIHRTILLVIAAAAAGGFASSTADSRTPTMTPVSRVALSGDPGTRMHNDPGVGERFIPAHPDSVWRVMPDVFEKLGIEEAGADPASRTFGRMGFRARRIEGKRLSSFIDCGMGPTAVPNADHYQVTMTVLSRVTPGDDGGTVVTTTLTATARSREFNTNPVTCQSKGVLEMRVAQLVMLGLLERSRGG